jgi:arginase family enzyme
MSGPQGLKPIYCDSERVTNLEKLDADFAVLGVPFDEGACGQTGEHYGPRDMREASQEYNQTLPSFARLDCL